MIIVIWAVLFCAYAGPANAAPAVGALVTWLGGGAFASFIVQTFLGAGISLLGRKMAEKKRAKQNRGIKTSFTQTGGTNPLAIPVGVCATAGVWVCPPLSHTVTHARSHLTYVISLGDMPGVTLEGLIVSGTRSVITDTLHDDYGYEVEDYEGHLWVKYYDGSQTQADPMMLDKYGTDPDFPWSENMVGYNKPYVILTMRHDPDFWGTPKPEFLFELLGIPLYDLRKDDTVGGSGDHRIDDPSTWEQTQNLSVITYAVKRGITLPSGHVWGGGSNDLPLSIWAAAMNESDRAIESSGGGTEPQFRGGIEILVNEQPSDYVNELMAGCAGEVADVGGAWHIHVGAPSLPVFFFNDDDLNAAKVPTYDPFPGIESTINGVSIKHPSPEASWRLTSAPEVKRPDLEQQDRDQSLPAELVLNVVPYSGQAQRLGRAYVNDSRRFRQHNLPLPPDANHLNVLDTVSWSSSKYGYDGKLFSIERAEKNPYTLQPALGIRERDPSDYDWSSDFEIPVNAPPARRTPPEPLVLGSFGVQAVAIAGASGSTNRPGIQINYTMAGVDSIYWRVRLKETQADLGTGVVLVSATGHSVLPFAAQPKTEYQVQALVNVTGQKAWTAWLDVTTFDLRIGVIDLAPEVFETVQAETENSLRRFASNRVVPSEAAIERLAASGALAMARDRKEELRQGARLAKARFELEEIITAEGEARATAILELIAKDADVVAQILEERNSRVLGDEASTEALNSYISANDGVIAAAVANIATLVSENQAQANSLDSMGVQLGTFTASLSDEATARADGDQASADALSAFISGNDIAMASVLSSVSTLVAENASQATTLSQINASLGAQSATISEHASAIAGVGASIQYSLDVNGHLSGWAHYSDVQAGGAVYSEFVFAGDAFRIVGANGQGEAAFTFYPDARLVNGVMAPAGLYNNSLMTTENLIVTGSMSATFATIGHFKSAPSGERLEIKDDRLSVFDGNNVERVRLGDLS